MYDIRQYDESNLWGPFQDDGSGKVDWEKMEVLQCVSASFWQLYLKENPALAKTLAKYPDCRFPSHRVIHAFEGATPNTFIPRIPRSITSSLEEQDPYNVTGTWLRVIYYIPYGDFEELNYPEHGRHSENCQDCPRPPLYVDDVPIPIRMKLRVTKIGAAGYQGGSNLPIVHFEGTAYVIGNPQASSYRPTVQGILIFSS